MGSETKGEEMRNTPEADERLNQVAEPEGQLARKPLTHQQAGQKAFHSKRNSKERSTRA